MIFKRKYIICTLSFFLYILYVYFKDKLNLTQILTCSNLLNKILSIL